MSDGPELGIAISTPSGDGSHVITTPVEEIVTEGHPKRGEGLVGVGDNGAIVTAEQCFRLSDLFNRAGEVIERHHDKTVSEGE